jgi:hypothetical protein
MKLTRNSRTWHLLKILDGRSPLSTAELMEIMYPHLAEADGSSRRHMLSRLGTLLRTREAGGEVIQEGTAPSRLYHHAPTAVWGITPDGRKALRDCEQAHERAVLAAEADASRAAVRRMQLRAMDHYRGRTLTPGQRSLAVAELRMLGIPNPQAGDALGLSQERVRQILLERDPGTGTQREVSDTPRGYQEELRRQDKRLGTWYIWRSLAMTPRGQEAHALDAPPGPVRIGRVRPALPERAAFHRAAPAILPRDQVGVRMLTAAA